MNDFSTFNYSIVSSFILRLSLSQEESNLDAVIHLGDYIYEYGADGYGSENAESIGRVADPQHEIISLDDYRTRYKQVKSDVSLQNLHAQVPFIPVWDDHEVTNDAYRIGGENHQDDEGLFIERKMAALQAYFEWMPIRPVIEGNQELIYRSFRFGDLVDLHMLDTRLVGRDKQLDYKNYTDTSTGAFDHVKLQRDLEDPSQKMLGDDQFNWLSSQMANTTAKWQVLGQQVLMGSMLLPAAIVTNKMSIKDYGELGRLAVLVRRAQASDPTLTADEIAYLTANRHRLTVEVVALLQLPNIPYNLDAWDGYAHEREKIFSVAKQNSKNLIVLAGDTHNAWANRLTDKNNEQIGYEFATSSITSPGLESYLEIKPEDVTDTEHGIVSLIDGLDYMNVSDRGFLVVTFEQSSVTAKWRFVSTILDTEFTELSGRSKEFKINLDA